MAHVISPEIQHMTTMPARPRAGCLGCLFQLLALAAVGGVLFIAMIGVFAPWAFYLGGKFHILPYWQGVGKAHAKSGDYVIYVYFGPTPNTSKMSLDTSLAGTARVCTPRGENIYLKLGGGMRRHLNLSTDGEAIHLYMHHWGWNASFTNDLSPHLELNGRWQNPNLVMDDHSSIARAFQPDGTVYHGRVANGPYLTEIVPITFRPGSYSDFKAACAAIAK